VGRDLELEALAQVAARVTEGSGRLIVIEGAPGTGKTALLDEAGRIFAAAGMSVLAARAAELEIDFPFGVVRQLLGRLTRYDDSAELFEGAAELARPLVSEADISEAAAAEDVSFARLHGLYWLCVNLSERGPVALLVDDAQWCDVGSLRFIDFLGRRVRELPVVVAVTARDGVNRGPDGEMERLMEHGGVEVLRLGALSKPDVATLVERTFREAPDPAFTDSCYAATRGSPLLLRALIQEIAARSIPPDRQGAREVVAVNPAAVSQLVQRRLAALPAPARTLAEAVGVVGDNVPVSDITAYAELPSFEEDSAVSGAIDALVEAQILEFEDGRLRYTHPIVRSSVYQALSPTARAEGHKRAAELLRAHGDSERLAAHLLACPPLGAEWVAPALRAAAKRAASLGALESARRYLSRALEEEHQQDGRLELLLELGAIEQVLDRTAAEATLRQAVEAARSPGDRFRAQAALGGSLVFSSGRAAEAHEVLLSALRAAPPDDEEARMAVGTEIRMNAHVNGYLNEQQLAQIEELPDRDEAERSTAPSAELMLACMSLSGAVSGELTADESAELARFALAQRRTTKGRRTGTGPIIAALRALMYADRLSEAHGILSALMADAQQRGSMYDFGFASWSRSEVGLRRGDLREAEADATVAFATLHEGGWSAISPRAVATLVEVQVERGESGQARESLAAVRDWQESGERTVGHLHYARGVVWAAEGNFVAALEDFMAVAELGSESDREFASRLPWRAAAALAAHELGQRDRAAELASADLAAARRYRGPRTLGLALRVAGTVDPSENGATLLEEACEVLAKSEANLEYGKGLLALARRRTEHDRDGAKELLSRALEIAEDCGARMLSTDVKAALVDAGGRPKRTARRGLDSLTASERRISEMAAQRLTNKEIAQALFITTKTVELHLGNAYKKLGIRSRQQLPDVLGVTPA
jgi:DNA-binding CsgD family transcriptional regulator